MMHPSSMISIVMLCLVTYAYAQQCDQPSDVARFNCFPDINPSQQACEARKCCWRPPVQRTNLSGYNDEPDVPYCYYSSDFPGYEVMSSATTDFGQRLQLFRSGTTYLPNDIHNLTVDLIFETQQRFRIKIYDSQFNRYQVPLPVPVVQKKVDMTDYDVVVQPKPFSLLITRKSTGATL